MTYEEAIKDIDKIIKVKFSPSSVPASLWMAIEALKKQIPMKPMHSGAIYDCPRCLEDVGMVTTRGRLLKKHHCRCGQCIDWSEVTG